MNEADRPRWVRFPRGGVTRLGGFIMLRQRPEGVYAMTSARPTEELPAVTAEMIAEAVDRIVRRFRPLKVILFGSHARGQAGPHSDVDLLVVLEDGANKMQGTVAILRELRGVGFAKDVVVTTSEEIARRGHLVSTVLGPALREGKVLYERP